MLVVLDIMISVFAGFGSVVVVVVVVVVVAAGVVAPVAVGLALVVAVVVDPVQLTAIANKLLSSVKINNRLASLPAWFNFTLFASLKCVRQGTLYLFIHNDLHYNMTALCEQHHNAAGIWLF